MEIAVVEVYEPNRSTLRLELMATLVVGRDCEGLILTDPLLSRRHVELRPAGEGRVTLTDLGSTNGTTVGGERVRGKVELSPGDRACVGGVRIDVIDAVPHLRPSVATEGPRGSQGRPDFRTTSIASVADAVLESPDPLRDEHRQGTITIMFSDIEDSTQSLSQSGDRRWFELLQAHNEVVVDCVARSGGSIVKNQGDGFMMTFPSARRAVQAALDVNERLEERPDAVGSIRVRMGLNTGEVIVDDDGDLFGRHVNLAARIANCAVGGEILVSSLTKAILETRGDLSFADPRVVELKGLDGRHEVFPVVR